MECILCKTTENIIKFNGLNICISCKELSVKENHRIENIHMHEYVAPTEVLPNLYIGSINSSVSEEKLRNLRINKIIIAGKFINKYMHEGFEYLELLIDDSLEQDMSYFFDISSKFIAENNTGNTLVYCYSGISRSATIVINYLMKIGMPYDDAYTLLKSKKNNICPNTNFVNQLKNQ